MPTGKFPSRAESWSGHISWFCGRIGHTYALDQASTNIWSQSIFGFLFPFPLTKSCTKEWSCHHCKSFECNWRVLSILSKVVTSTRSSRVARKISAKGSHLQIPRAASVLPARQRVRLRPDLEVTGLFELVLTYPLILKMSFVCWSHGSLSSLRWSSVERLSCISSK